MTMEHTRDRILSGIHLALFLSRATPLGEWERIGILEREIALYRRLRPHLAGLTIVTSGGEGELAYQEPLGDIHILYNRWGFSPNVYSLLAPWLHWRDLRNATVFKTNQLDGAWTAVIAGKVHTRPVIVRAGYPWALNFRRTMAQQKLKGVLVEALERFSIRRASCVVVTTNRLKAYVEARHSIPSWRLRVTPNYVDTELFRPLPSVSAEPGRILFVGSLKMAKNLATLLQAAKRLEGAHVVLLGDGPLRAALERQVASLGIEVIFAGRVPNQRLPKEINRSAVFVLPSLYEGHPKALIEAMSCGVVVVGTNVEGIRDVIRHGETGLLCEPTAEALAAALGRALTDTALRDRLGQAARAFAVREYSLERVVRLELGTLTEVGL
jgi:glycosyltransferase involved in cell wall biosynthesis